jgi:hypothetical protein
MTQKQTEIKTIEATIKFIFNKTNLTSNDVVIGTRLISKWKKLSGWIERKEYPIKFI